MSVETVVSVLVGGAITFAVSWSFYVRAARALQAETAAVRRKVDSVLYGLEDAGIVRLSKNPSGEVEGVLVVVEKDVTLRWSVEAPQEERKNH